jgi:hypothetical protein
MALPPAVGSAAPGDLVAELQSRSLWLGVDPAVDASGFVLLSDIQGQQQEIDDGILESAAYTDSQIATRAPTVHNHTSSQISDFVPAVQAVVDNMPSASFSPGMIVMWSGSLAAIGVGALAGWALCDGSNGTPNLRDRFVIGAGNKAPGATSPSTSMPTDVQGGHTHTVAGTALTLAQSPAHSHTVTATGTGTGSTDSQGAHTHTYNEVGPTGGAIETGGNAGNSSVDTTSSNGAHTHNVTVSSVTVSGTTNSQGGGATHDHGLSTDGSHSHTISLASLRETIPYYALAYIMKL